jgi:Cu-Zn family superoxide dismutase
MKNLLFSACTSILVFSIGCGSSPPEPPKVAAPEPPVTSASASPEETEPSAPPAAASASAEKAPEAPPQPVAIEVPFEAKSGSKLTGTAKFAEEGDGVRVSIELKNLKPGQVATHVHEKGDCSAPDASSAGGHFNPDNHPHARPPTSTRHLGDLGNITVDAHGSGTLDIVVQGANLKPGDPHSFLDRAIIVHEKKDDGGQPTGNAGGRIGCAVIKKS